MAGARLFIVGFESGDAQILKNIKKGATVEMGRAFMKNCLKAGVKVHGDFIIGPAGRDERHDSENDRTMRRNWIARRSRFRWRMPMPGTELHDTMAQQGS